MDLTSLTPLEGGRSGQTFLGEVAGERCVVRIYAAPDDRGDAAAEIDAAVLRLVRGLVPVPDVLEVRRPDPGAGVPGLLVTSYVAGTPADAVVPGLDHDGLAALGHRLGEVAATLAGMPMLRAGRFLDGELRIGDQPDHHDRDVPSRASLVHGDLTPRHVLLDPESLEVRAVTGWGRAHAGDPETDLALLLAGDPPGELRRAALTAYTSRHGGTSRDVDDARALP